MLSINFLDVADLAIVFCQGAITSKEDIDVLRQTVTAKLHKVGVVLDFSEVETVGSEALVALVALWHTADRQAKRLGIFNPSPALYLELRIRSLCRIDAALLRLLPQAEALMARPARHGGPQLSHALSTYVLEGCRCAWPSTGLTCGAAKVVPLQDALSR